MNVGNPRRLLPLGVLVLGVTSGCASRTECVAAPQGTRREASACVVDMTHAGPVGCNWDGRLEMFVRGRDGALYHQWQTSPGGIWSGWESLAGDLTSQPVVGSNRDGRLEIFVRGTDGALFHRWQVVPGGTWADWESLGGRLTSEIGLRRDEAGRLEVFVRGTDGAVWHLRQRSPGGDWSGWSPLQGDASELGVRLEPLGGMGLGSP
jgi:hypothetical protein